VCACGWALEEPCLYNSRACIFFPSGFFFVTLAHNPKFFDLFFPGSLMHGKALRGVVGQRELWNGVVVGMEEKIKRELVLVKRLCFLVHRTQ